MKRGPIRFILYLLCIAAAYASIFSCRSSKTLKKMTAVCIWDRTALRIEPREDGKWLASLQLGEQVTWYGKTALDTANRREYMQITLSDGKSGWAKSDLLVANARVGAIKEPAPVYQRPDLLTLSDEQFETMEMVAVTDTTGHWSKVIGSERRKKGWIRTGNIIFDSREVTIAILVKKAMDENRTLPLSELLDPLKKDLSVPDSYFLKKLEEQILAEPESDENESDIHWNDE